MSTSWQRCQVHFLRHFQAHVRKSERRSEARFAPFSPFGSERWFINKGGKIAEELRGQFFKFAQLRDKAESEVLAYLSYPKSRRAIICSTNPIERLNREIKRCTDAAGVFPNVGSILRLVGTLLRHQNRQ